MTTPRVTVPVEPTPDLTNEQIQSVMLEAIREVRATVTDHVEAATMDADIARMERGPVDMGETGWEVMRAVHRRLAALATREEAPAEAGELDLYDDKVQAGIAWTMRQWGETLGLKTWDMGDGSESVEGDVGAEIHTILVDAGLRDPETNEMAALRAQPQAREDAQPVAIVPPHCTGASLAFEPGVLHVSKDGSGYIAIDEEHFSLEDDRCQGPDGPEGSVHWITRLDASEVVALRDFLTGFPHPAPDALRAIPEKWFEAAHYATEPGLPAYEQNMRRGEFQRIVTPEALAALQAEQGAK